MFKRMVLRPLGRVHFLAHDAPQECRIDAVVNLILMRKLVILANESQRPYKVHEAKRKIQPIFYATLPWFPNYAVHPVRPSVCLSVRLSHAYRYRTSSSAVADRPCDASRMSVVSFNSTIRRAQSSVIGYFGFIFTAAYN